MDTITHLAFGACIGEVVIGKHAGKAALVMGAVAQCLPDIDVLGSLWLPPTVNLLFHRGIMHSFFFAVLASLLFAAAARRLFRKHNMPLIKWFLFFCLQLFLHDVLDSCNAYGTGLLEPFSHQRFSFHLLYVADPLFTISLLLSFIILFIINENHRHRPKWVIAGILPSVIYLSCAVYNKASIYQNGKSSLEKGRISYKSILVTPTPFNSFLWNIIASTDSGYFIGYRSVFDKKTTPVAFTYYPKNEYLLKEVDTTADVKRLLRFADNYFIAGKKGDTLTFNVLRFGQRFGWGDPHAVFTFQYFLNPGYSNTLVVQRGRFNGWNKSTIAAMYRRIKGI